MLAILVRAVALAALFGLVPASASGFVSQDDASSGRDAGDASSEALPIAFGTHKGTLVGGSALGTPLCDTQDWYVLQAERGMRIEVSLKGTFTGVRFGNMALEVRAPSGDLAQWVEMSGPAEVASETLVLSETGSWRIRVSGDSQVGIADYEFGVIFLGVSSSVSKAGAGYLAQGLWIEAGQPTTMSATFVTGMAHGRSGRIQLYETTMSGDTLRSIAETTFPLAAQIAASTSLVSVDAWVGPDGTLYQRQTLSFTRSSGSAFNYVAVAAADEAFITLALEGTPLNATPVFSGGRERVLAARHSDFEGTGATAPGLRVSRTVAISIEVATRAIGDYDCFGATCEIEGPDGATAVGSGIILNLEQGGYRFVRRNEISMDLHPEEYLLFGVDVRLPIAMN